MKFEKSAYQRKLTHPDWQKKRLEILSRDQFICQHCGARDKELHVHHVYYLPNTEPQNYPDKAYITLCYECHEREEMVLNQLSTNIIMQLRRCGADSFSIGHLIEAIEKYSSVFTGFTNPVFDLAEDTYTYSSFSEDQRMDVDILISDIQKERIQKHLQNNGKTEEKGA